MNVQWEWFTFPFEDDDLTNKALASALLGLATMLVIPVLIFYGYFMRILRTVIEEDRMELPPFDDIGGYFADGLKVFVITIVYSAPVLVLVCGLSAIMFVVPLLGLPFAEQSPEIVAGLTGLTFLILPFFFLLIFPISLAIGYFSQIGLARFAADRTLSSAFDFRAVWELGRDGLKYFGLALLLYFVLGFALNLVIQVAAFTIILLCLLPFLIGPLLTYMVAVQAALIGKAYRATLADREVPAEPVPAG